MTLDLFTLTVTTAVVASVASMTYIIETILRRDTGPGRLWAVAFLCGVLTTFAYMAWSAGIGNMIPVAIGNALFVLVPGFMWLGSRRFNDRPGAVAAAVVAVLAVVTLGAALIETPVRGSWGGWPVMAVSLVLLFTAGAIEILRAPLRRLRTSWALTAVLMFVAVFYAVRVVLFVTFGPDSPLFSTWFGSISANFVTMTLTVVAAIVTSVLRSHRTAESRYAWLTEGGVAADGVMRARTFADAAADILARASWRADGVAIIVIHVDGVAEIRRAFGAETADAVVHSCRQAVRRYAPASAIVGEDADTELAVCTPAPTAADARRLGATIYRGCMEELSAAESGLFPVVGVGVAFTEDIGYEFASLQRIALAAARLAIETPGSSVLLGASGSAS